MHLITLLEKNIKQIFTIGETDKFAIIVIEFKTPILTTDKDDIFKYQK